MVMRGNFDKNCHSGLYLLVCPPPLFFHAPLPPSPRHLPPSVSAVPVLSRIVPLCLRFPESVSLSPCLSLSVLLYSQLYCSIPVSLCLSPPLCLCHAVSLCPSLSVSLTVSLSLPPPPSTFSNRYTGVKPTVVDVMMNVAHNINALSKTIFFSMAPYQMFLQVLLCRCHGRLVCPAFPPTRRQGMDKPQWSPGMEQSAVSTNTVKRERSVKLMETPMNKT